MKNGMRGMWRSLVSLLMALCLVVGLVPSAAFAKEEQPEDMKVALEELAQLIAENYDEEEAKAMLAELKVQLEAAAVVAIPLVEAKLVELKAELETLEIDREALKAELAAAAAAAKPAIEAKIAEIEAKIAQLVAYIQELNAKLMALVAAVEAAIAAVETAIAEGVAAVKQMVATVEELVAAVEAMIEAVPQAIADAMETLQTAALLLYYSATYGVYIIDEDSSYVALGDGAVAGESYVDLVAATMGEMCETYTYTNLAKEGLMIQDVYTVMAENADAIANADLVTVNFGNNGFTTFTGNYLLAMMNDVAVELDWVSYVGEEGLPYVAEAKAKLYEELVANGVSGELMGIDITELLVAALEAYAYSYVAYAANLPLVVDQIHALNPEALVVVVGTYNPMENMILDLNGEKLAVGEYMQYLVDAANYTALGYALVAQEAIFVDAPAVEIAEPADEITAMNLLMEILRNKGAGMNPSEAGHAYIAEQILNSLFVFTLEDGMLGDADSNGVVNTLDAMLILQYYTEAISEDELDLNVCDLDGNGVVNTLDAFLVLQYYTGAIEKFPVEA